MSHNITSSIPFGSGQKEESQKQTSETSSNPNSLLFKFQVLRTGLIKEKEKNSSLEKKLAFFQEQINKKDEQIIELKEHLQKYHDEIPKNNALYLLSDFFKNVDFNNEKENLINKFEQENLMLKQEIDIKTKNFELLNDKYKQSISDLNDLNIHYKKKFDKIDVNNEKIITDLKNENEKLKTYLNENSIKIREMEKKIIAFNSDKIYMDNNIKEIQNELSSCKEDNNNKDKIISELQKEIAKFEIKTKEYNKIIEDLTPIKYNHIFIGKQLPNTNYYNSNVLIKNEVSDDIKTICISFDFNEKTMKVKIGNNIEFKLKKKEIIDIINNTQIEGQIKLFIQTKNKGVEDYLCQFSKKEANYLVKFYKLLKEINLENKVSLCSYLDFY